MNDVHKAVAGKLRSAADALRADAGYQDPDVGMALLSEIERIELRAEEIDPPKPAVKEPTELGAVVVDSQGREYVRHTRDSLAPWIAAAPKDLYRPYRYFKDLDVVEVLRIGVGESPLKPFFEGVAEGLGDTTADEAPADVDELMTSAGFVRTPAQEAYVKGAADMKANALVVVRKLAFTAITAEQAGAYDKAAQAIGDLS